MERRGEKRNLLTKEVLLCCHAFGLARATTRDISSSGVFVTTGHLSLDENDMVDVCFMIKDHEIKQFHKVSAKVARVNKAGLGLSFMGTMSPDVFCSID